MTRSKSAEEVEQEYVRCMGKELGVLFSALWNEVSWLHMKWGEFMELYGTKPSRITLLNQAAPLFFRIVQDSLFEDTLLHITRLTDSPKSAGKDTLTIRRLPTVIRDKSLAKEVGKLVDDALKKSSFCRDWRNRHIAHRDLQLALDEGARPLETASRAKVKLSIEAIGRVLNAVSDHYDKSITAFAGALRSQGTVAFLHVLDDGLKREQERFQRLKSGEHRPDDREVRNL